MTVALHIHKVSCPFSATRLLESAADTARNRDFKKADHWYVPFMTLKAIIHDAEEGGFWAEVPAHPGCFTQGETIKELETNLLEAIEGWLLAAEPEGAVPDGRVLEVAV